MIGASDVAQTVADMITAEGVRVYLDVVPPSPQYPYAALFFDAGLRTDESVAALVEGSDFYPRLTCSGVDATQVRLLRDRALSVIGRELDVEGVLARIEHAATSPITRDDDVPDRVVLYAVDTLRLRALTA